MSNTNYFRTRWNQSSSLQRRAARRTRLPVFRDLVLKLGRGWHTRRIGRRERRRRWLQLTREGRAAASLMGWRRRA